MGKITVHELKKKDLTGSLVIVSTPTVGLISSIVANYIITNLNMERIAVMESDDFYPAAIIQNGIPTPPVTIYAGDQVCSTEDGVCNQVVVVMSELPLKPSDFAPFADTIIDWCKEKGCKMLTTVEGLQTSEGLGKEVKDIAIYHVGSNEKTRKMFQVNNTEPLQQGIISGVSGILLYKGNIKNFDVGCLLVEAHSEFPDSRSAAEALKVLDALVPNIKLDPTPLLEEAQKIEEKIKMAMSQMKQNPSSKKLTDPNYILYG